MFTAMMIAAHSVAEVLILGNVFERAAWGLLGVFRNCQYELCRTVLGPFQSPRNFVARGSERGW